MFVLISLYKIGGQFNERLFIWQPSGIFLYSTVIILICFMLCWRIKYDDDGSGVNRHPWDTARAHKRQMHSTVTMGR